MGRRGIGRLTDAWSARRRRGRHAPPTDATGPPVVIVGGGVGGLLTALAFAREGVAVTIVERDDLDPATDVDSAFRAERPGAPQAHQTHGFLGRVLKILAVHHPEVLAELEAVGGSTMSMTANLGEAVPGDEDLRVLVVRRTTFEHVLRQHARAASEITFRTATVSGLHSDHHDDQGRPVVDGVVLTDGTTMPASAVVLCTGTRGDVVGWLGAIGAPCPEESHPGRLVYLTRWYRRTDPDAPWEPRLLGHLPYLKVLGVPGDGDSLSVTLAVPSADSELRSALSNPERFERACRAIPTLDQFFGPGVPPAIPVGPVRPMGGFVNRRRRFVDADGNPTAIGVHALGDAHTATNPILGRGCSLAAVQSTLLVAAHRAHPDDAVRRARAYEAACRADVDPWYEDALLMERLEADPSSVEETESPAAAGARLVGALFALGSDDPVMGRALARYINLLRTPVQMMADRRLLDLVLERAAVPGAFDAAPVSGPGRDELLAALGVTPREGDPEPAADAAADTATDTGVTDRPTPLTATTWPVAAIHPSAHERRVDVGEVALHIVEAGPADGPPVILTHGFPELAYSWRHQITPLADAGYRVVAVDQRGFGGSDAPSAVEDYDIHHLAGDLHGLLDVLELPRATLVAHDWGAVVADAFSLMHPGRLTGLLTVSVPPVGRLTKAIPDWMDDVLGGAFNYVQHFQAPGVAEVELDANVEELIWRGLAGPIVREGDPPPPPVGPDAGLIERLPRPEGLPAWLTRPEVDHFVAEFRRTGFAPALSWYRNLHRNWATTAHLDGVRLTVPSAFVTGQYDLMNVVFPRHLMDAHVTDHRFTVVLDDVGHWVQQEAPEEVTALVLRFLDEVSAGAGPP